MGEMREEIEDKKNDQDTKWRKEEVEEKGEEQ